MNDFESAIAAGAKEITPEEARTRIVRHRSRLTSKIRRHVLRKRDVPIDQTFAECAAFVPTNNASLPSVRPLCL